jgi:uncharacterized repeat protein (TIGR01451 family)/gliding motility-associated-like protein
MLIVVYLFSVGLSKLSAQINSNKFRVDMVSSTMIACENSNQNFSELSVRSKIDTARDFQISFDLPPGIFYVPATVNITSQSGSGDFLVSEFDISNPNTPIFSLQRPGNAPWAVNDIVVFRFQKTSACAAVQFSYNGGLFKDQHTIDFVDDQGTQTASDNDLTVNSYNLLRPLLVVSDIIPLNLKVGDTGQRNVVITNSGNGSLGRFSYFVDVPLALQSTYSLSFNGTGLTPVSINSTIYEYEIDLTQAPFLGNVGDGDNLFENEAITMVETITMGSCLPAPLATQHYTQWGCSTSNICQVSNNPIGDIVIDENWPNFELQEINVPVPRFDAVNSYSLQLVNSNWADPAYNVNFNIGFGWGSESSSPSYNPLHGTDYRNDRILSNFHFSGGSALTPNRWPATDSGYGLGSYLFSHDFFTTDPDGPGGLEDLDGDGFFDDLAPGASTEFNLDMEFLPLTPACVDTQSTYINYEPLQFNMWSTTQCGNLTQKRREDLSVTDVYTDALFNWEAPEKYDIDLEEGAPGHLSFIGNFKASGDAPTCNGIELISNDPSTIYTVDLTVPNGITLDASAPAEYSQSGNTITFQVTNLSDFEIDGWRMLVPVDFPLNIDCSTYTGGSTVNIPYTISYNSNCFDRQLHCGTFEMEAHCNTSCTGAITTGFEANRVTAGWTDPTMTTKVSLDPNVHDVKMYMPRDEMVINASMVMNNVSSDNLFFQIRYVTENTGINMADVIQFESGSITINDLSSGSQTTPITVSPNITTQGTNDNFMVFDLSNYRAIISGTYEYGEGNAPDEVDIELHLRFKDTFPAMQRFYEFYSFEGSFYIEDNLGTPTTCEVYNDRAFFFEPEVNTKVEANSSVTGCDEKMILIELNMLSGTGDKFPDEFRPLATWDQATIEIPAGMHFNDFVVGYGWPNVMPANQVPSSDNGGLQYSVTGNVVTITKGPNFVYPDQGGNTYSKLLISVYATSQTPAVSNHDLSLSYNKFAYTDTPEAFTDNHTNTFTYNNVEYYLSASPTTESGNKLTEGFTIDICKEYATTDTDFNWIRVDTGGAFQITSAIEEEWNPGTPLNVVEANGVYYIEIGQLQSTGNYCKKIRFEGTYNNCNPIDIRVSQNYDCISYPTDYSATAFFNEEIVTLDPIDAVAQLAILSQPSSTVDMCDIYNVELEVRNAGGADLINPLLDIEIPGDITGLEFVNNTIDVEYPRNSGNIEQLVPQYNGNTVTLNLMDHSVIAGLSGILGTIGSVSIDDQIAIISMAMSPNCSFTSNTGTTYTISGDSPCGLPATGSGSRLSTNPIIITGAEPPYSTNSIAISTPDLYGCETGNISVETEIVDGLTGNSDYSRIILPSGLEYVNGSFASTGTVNITFIAANTVGDHQELEISLPPGAGSTDTIAYNFDVQSTALICDGNYDVLLETYVSTTGIMCNGTSCGTTEIFTGGANTSMTVHKGVLSEGGFVADATYVKMPSSTGYSIDFSLENTGTVDLPSGMTYDVFCADGAGNKLGSSIYQGTLSQGISVGGSLQENISFSTAQFCGDNGFVLVEFSPSAANCFCTDLSILINSSEVFGGADIALVKTVNNNMPQVGETLTFIIEVSNSGPEDATNVQIQDVLPSGLTLVAGSISNGGVLTGNTITWDLVSVPMGTQSLTYQTTVNPPTGTAGEYVNIVQVMASDQFDPDSTPNNDDGDQSEDDEDSVTVTGPSTDIAITKNVDQTTAFIGDQVEFTVSVENLGALSATNIAVEDVLPNGFQLISFQVDMGTFDEVLGHWDIPVLNANEVANLSMVVELVEGDTYTNVARLLYLDQMDPNMDNDSDSATVTPDTTTCQMVVYNEFSPNGDGSNEVFYVDCIENYPNNHLQVYNRWGNMVFEAYNYQNTWDGTSYGKATINAEEKLPVGTYFYVLDLGNDDEPLSGWLYITR